MASERIVLHNEDGSTVECITLPLDANALDAAAVEAAARANSEWSSLQKTIDDAQWHDNYKDAARARDRQAQIVASTRAAIAAYAHHVAGGAR